MCVCVCAYSRFYEYFLYTVVVTAVVGFVLSSILFLVVILHNVIWFVRFRIFMAFIEKNCGFFRFRAVYWLNVPTFRRNVLPLC